MGENEQAALVLESSTGTAIVYGDRVELPAKEFALLSELAARPGEAVPATELLTKVWPETSWMTPQDLYWHVSRLRRLIGDGARDAKVVRNRRGFGYLVDLPAHQVRVVRGVAPPIEVDGTTTPDRDSSALRATAPDALITADESAVAGQRVSGAFPLEEVGPEAVESHRHSMSNTPLILASVVLALVISWSAGFVLSRWSTGTTPPSGGGSSGERQPQGENGSRGTRQQFDTPEDEAKRKENKVARRRGTRRSKESRGSTQDAQPGPATIAVVPPTGSSRSRPGQPRSSQGRRKSDSPASEPEKPAPPAPTRYLYHLVDKESGDHLVTTDGNTASAYEARGYSGGAIARVYTYQENNTKAIATNRGTGYIFTTSAPQTDPASQTRALWYASNGAGDFFYTTSEAEAEGPGWNASVVGYVRTL